MSYQPRDQVAWRAARTAEILAARPLVARCECPMCGWALGRGALWCSTACADDYAAERARLIPTTT